jgi:peptidoglycan hydrolase-like protein with peptidoglycan-binding domain
MGALAIVGLAGAALAGWKVFGKKTTQGMPSGTPGVYVVSPVPGSVTSGQKTGTVTAPPQQSSLQTISHALGLVQVPVAQTLKPGGGVVYSPPNAVQPGQSLPIVVSPTGQAAIGLSSVSDVQRSLNTLGIQPLLKVDGSLGPATIANIKNFQSAHGLAVDGNAGPATKSALSAALSALAAGPKAAVGQAASTATPTNTANLSPKDIQHILNLLGATPPLQEDGILGPKSVSALKSFQVSHGLTADGIAGPKTKAALAIATKGT